MNLVSLASKEGIHTGSIDQGIEWIWATAPAWAA
jgi:hypothetical protein